MKAYVNWLLTTGCPVYVLLRVDLPEASHCFLEKCSLFPGRNLIKLFLDSSEFQAVDLSSFLCLTRSKLSCCAHLRPLGYILRLEVTRWALIDINICLWLGSFSREQFAVLPPRENCFSGQNMGCKELPEWKIGRSQFSSCFGDRRTGARFMGYVVESHFFPIPHNWIKLNLIELNWIKSSAFAARAEDVQEKIKKVTGGSVQMRKVSKVSKVRLPLSLQCHFRGCNFLQTNSFSAGKAFSPEGIGSLQLAVQPVFIISFCLFLSLPFSTLN